MKPQQTTLSFMFSHSFKGYLFYIIMFLLVGCSSGYDSTNFKETKEGTIIWVNDNVEGSFFNSKSYSWQGGKLGKLAHGQGTLICKVGDNVKYQSDVDAYYGVVDNAYVDVFRNKNEFILLSDNPEKDEEYEGLAVYYNDGLAVIGDYKEGNFNGNVDVFIYDDLFYKGKMKDGMQSDEGISFYYNGDTIFNGKFEKGTYSEGTSFLPSHSTLYSGEWKNACPKKATYWNDFSQYQLGAYNMVLAANKYYLCDTSGIAYCRPKELPEKRIYLLDVTGSMEGRGIVETPNIFDSVKDNLAQAVASVSNTQTEIAIIPFTNRPFEAYRGTYETRDSIASEIRNISTNTGDTNVLAAWERGIQELDSTKLNYIFLLTDGIHNDGLPIDSLYSSLSRWGDLSKSNEYFAFYVMLTPNAKEDKIVEIANNTHHLWPIESPNVLTTFVSTNSSFQQNVNLKTKARLVFATNDNELDLNKLGIKLQMDNSDSYEIKNVFVDAANLNVDFDVVKKKDQKDLPINEKRQLHITYDHINNPLTFFIPEDIDFSIDNMGVRAAAITDISGCVDSLDFGESTFYEPFRGILKGRPRILEKSLEYMPFKWLTPDTITLTKKFRVFFNDECIRSKSKITFNLQGSNLDGCKLLLRGNDVSNGRFSVKADTNIVTFALQLFIPANKYDEHLLTNIMIEPTGIDHLNGEVISESGGIKSTIEASPSGSIHWWLWILWLICALLVLFLLILLLLLLLWLMGILRLLPPLRKGDKGSKKSRGSKGGNRDANGPMKHKTIPWVDYYYKRLKDREVIEAIKDNCMGGLPDSDGAWSGDAGKSCFVHDKNVVPKDRYCSNMHSKTYGQIYEENGIANSIKFVNGGIRFPNEIIKIRLYKPELYRECYMLNDMRSAIHRRLHKIGAEMMGMSTAEFTKWKDSEILSWHEDPYTGEFQLVKKEIHGNIAHQGHIAVFKMLVENGMMRLEDPVVIY